ncbi:uncharacterized protein LOC111639767 [Centruroides sculpturatus]|uniref:uncharacterized protein LOC111639767 n=1 Tax=Centruroides sculpturatus TaxID=218467 RepID=UPI000C6EAAE8|nr:uncharacterized protein LOC111639767 [Centruroides sculpturatus]
MKQVLTSREISIKTRIRLAKCYVWSTLLYGAECWTMNASNEKKLKAFEMWMIRRMLRVSWKARRTNEDILAIANQKRTLLEVVRKRIVRYLGHVMRHNSLQKLLLEGMIEGQRGRGRPRKNWFSNIRNWTYLTYEECSREAQDRSWWHEMVVNLLTGEDT